MHTIRSKEFHHIINYALRCKLWFGTIKMICSMTEREEKMNTNNNSNIKTWYKTETIYNCEVADFDSTKKRKITDYICTGMKIRLAKSLRRIADSLDPVGQQKGYCVTC